MHGLSFPPVHSLQSGPHVLFGQQAVKKNNNKTKHVVNVIVAYICPLAYTIEARRNMKGKEKQFHYFIVTELL